MLETEQKGQKLKVLELTPEVPLVTCDVLILAVSLRVVCDDSSLVTRAEGLSMDSIVFDPSRVK